MAKFRPEIEDHIATLEEAIAFSNSVPVRQAMDYAVKHLRQLGDPESKAAQAERYCECLESVCEALELPRSETGPGDDPDAYLAAIEDLREMVGDADRERLRQSQNRFIAEAELHQYKALGRPKISASYPHDATIERLREIASATSDTGTGEITFAGDIGNWAWLLHELSLTEAATKISDPEDDGHDWTVRPSSSASGVYEVAMPNAMWQSVIALSEEHALRLARFCWSEEQTIGS